jgi:excisionase family DNA binding protein
MISCSESKLLSSHIPSGKTVTRNGDSPETIRRAKSSWTGQLPVGGREASSFKQAIRNIREEKSINSKIGMKSSKNPESNFADTLQDCSDVLNVTQVSKLLQICNQTVYKLLKTGKLQSITIGNEYRIPKLYLVQYLQQSSLSGIRKK